MSSGSVADDEAKTRRDSDLPEGPPAVADAQPPIGGRLSRYLVLEEVGKGGMGRVMRAYDPKLQREVALKLLRGGMADPAAMQRMVAEARAMARLSHPNVVAVYDVEELDRGQVALVMEFVAGKTLKAWIRDDAPSSQRIVTRFVEAGWGLAAAHAAGLLHRDFKPANVLVTMSTAKVTDFGIAKAMGAASYTDESARETVSADDLTGTGTIVGTPRYMAPEQHRGEPLDAATDQYGFCVALWEALCGEAPFKGKALAADKMRGPPAWPNSRVRKSVAKAVVRGLSPDPAMRWPSMHALLSALAPNGKTRRAGWLLGAAGLVAVGVVASGVYPAAGDAPCRGSEALLAGIWDEPRRDEVRTSFERVNKSYTDEAWARTDRTFSAYARDWTSAHTEACEATTIRGEQSPQMMDARMACLQRAAVHLGAAVDVLSDADADVVQKAHDVVGDLLPLDRCADIDVLTAEVEPPSADDADAVQAARAQLARAKNLQNAGRFEPAKRSIDAASKLLSDVEYGPVRSEVALAEGRVLEALGKYDESRAALESAVRSGSTWHQWDVVQRAAVLLMTVVGIRQQELGEAMSYEALAAGLSIGVPTSEADYRTGLASILMTKAQYADGEREYRVALALREKALGLDHPDVVAARHNVATALLAQGRPEDAETEHRAALALRVSTLGADHPSVAQSRSSLAGSLYGQGKLDEAEEEIRLALGVREAALGPSHPEVSPLRDNLATLLSAQGKLEEAEAEYRAGLALREASLGLDHPANAISHNNLATVLYAQEKYEQAEAEHRIALRMWLKSLGAEHPKVATSRANLATVLLELGRPEEALPLSQQAWKQIENDSNRAPHERAGGAFLLAQALVQTDKVPRGHEQAQALAVMARDLFGSAGANHVEARQEVETWLTEHAKG